MATRGSELAFFRRLLASRENMLREIERINGHLGNAGLVSGIAHHPELLAPAPTDPRVALHNPPGHYGEDMPTPLPSSLPFREAAAPAAPTPSVGSFDQMVAQTPPQPLQAPPPMSGIGSVGEAYNVPPVPADVALGFRAPNPQHGIVPPRRIRRPGISPARAAGRRALAY